MSLNVRILGVSQLQSIMFLRNLSSSTEIKKSTAAFIAMLSTKELWQLNSFLFNRVCLEILPDAASAFDFVSELFQHQNILVIC